MRVKWAFVAVINIINICVITKQLDEREYIWSKFVESW